MAISLIITALLILVFFFTRRYFIQGVVISGLKGEGNRLRRQHGRCSRSSNQHHAGVT